MALSNTFDPSPFNGMLAQFRGVLIPLLLNRYPPKASVNSKIIVFSELKGTINEGGGGWILQNSTEICINTTQNNITKLQTTLKLHSKILQATWYCKTAILLLKIKISAKLHQKSSKTTSLQTLTPPSYIHVHWPTNVNAAGLNSWQLLYLFFIIHVTTLPPTTTPFTRFLPKQRPDSGRLTYTGGLCMDCLNAVICHFSLYNSATICCVFLSRCVDALELAAWELVPFLFFGKIFGLLSLSPVICKIPENV